MKIVALHKTSASVVQMNDVDSITVDAINITVHGILATQTYATSQVFPRVLWIVRIIES